MRAAGSNAHPRGTGQRASARWAQRTLGRQRGRLALNAPDARGGYPQSVSDGENKAENNHFLRDDVWLSACPWLISAQFCFLEKMAENCMTSVAMRRRPPVRTCRSSVKRPSAIELSAILTGGTACSPLVTPWRRRCARDSVQCLKPRREASDTVCGRRMRCDRFRGAPQLSPQRHRPWRSCAGRFREQADGSTSMVGRGIGQRLRDRKPVGLRRGRQRQRIRRAACGCATQRRYATASSAPTSTAASTTSSSGLTAAGGPATGHGLAHSRCKQQLV